MAWVSNSTSARRRGKSTVAVVTPGIESEEALDEPGAAGAAHAFYGEGDGGGGGSGAVVVTVAGAGAVVFIVAALASATQQGRLDLGHAPCIQFRAVARVGGGGALCFRCGCGGRTKRRAWRCRWSLRRFGTDRCIRGLAGLKSE